MDSINIKLEGLKELTEKVDYLLARIEKDKLPPEHVIYDNNGLQEFLKISASKAADLRNTGKLAFSKESATGKIWYRLSDILAYLDSCYCKRF